MRTLYRQAVMALSSRLEPTNEAEHAALADVVSGSIAEAVNIGIWAEFGPKASPVVELVVTCRAAQIDDLPLPPDCDDPGCETCQGPRDFARTFLAANPGKHVALALVTIDLP